MNSGVGDGQGGLVCCDSWGHKELDMTERGYPKKEAHPASIQRDLAAKTGLCDPSEIRRVCKQTGGQRAMEKHMAICGQSEGTQKRDQHAADELPGRGLCKEARV